MPVTDASGTRYQVLRTREHWLRSTHDRTALDGARAVVTLAPTRPAAVRETTGDAALLRAGVAWDGCGRVFRSLPDQGRIAVQRGDQVVLLGDAAAPVAGCPPGEPWLVRPRGLAIDVDPVGGDRLYIADEGAARVVIVDLATARCIGRLRPPPVAGRASQPWDLCRDRDGRGALLLDRNARAVWRIRPDRAPILLLGPGGEWEHAGGASLHDPLAIARSADGAICVLDRDPSYAVGGGGGLAIVWARRHDIKVAVLPAGDVDPLATTTVALDGDGYLYVGGDPGLPVVRYALEGARADEYGFELHATGYWKAWSFDGGALATDPEGDVVFTTPDGLSGLAPAYPNYQRPGRVVSFALDGGVQGCVWHRIFLEACLPEQTGLAVRTLTADTLDAPATVTLQPPAGFTTADMRPWDGSPVVPSTEPGWVELPGLLRRPAGADRPFYDPGAEPGFDLYEALVLSPPGRYLWVELTLIGTDRRTPSVRGARVYFPRPSWLRYLPEVYREDPRAAEFLDRLLSIFEGFHGELDAVRDHLAILFEPLAVPPEALDWLAGWLGLVLDPRWPEDKRRQLVRRAARLYRDRGTLPGLTAMLGVYLDHPFHLVEAFRTRNAGGVVAGGPTPSSDGSGGTAGGTSIVGGGLVLAEPDQLLADTRRYAHRFTLFVAGELSAVERAVVGDILEVEKPAHTLAEVCDVTETCTVGQRALVGISTLVGRGPAFSHAVVGGDGWPLGRQVVVGGSPGSGGAGQVGTFNVGRNTVLR